MLVTRFLLLVLFIGVSPSAQAVQTRVAAASNFSAPIRALVTQFEQRSDHRITVSLGSSGKLYAQIRHGAPFDLFLSADSAKPAQLIKDGLAERRDMYTYATGSLVLWSADTSFPLSDGLALQQNRFRKLALANPRLAPYGQAAVDTLKALGLDKQTRVKWVIGENIAQAFQFVASRNAELGFIAASQWHALPPSERGTSWPVDRALHAPIIQRAVVLKRAAQNPATREFLLYLLSDEGQQVIAEFGYVSGEKSDV